MLFLPANQKKKRRTWHIQTQIHQIRTPHKHRSNGELKFLTKGDNNQVDDRGLYAPGQLWLTKSDMVGRAKGLLPYVGMVTIVMNDYPNFKVV